MATKINLTSLLPFDPLTEPSSISQRWKSWKHRFETYLVTLNITEDKQKRALLLYQAGQAKKSFTRSRRLERTLQRQWHSWMNASHRKIMYIMNFFWQAVQEAGETVDQFATRLRKLGAHCEIPNLERELKSAIIQNCHSKRLWRFALREQALMLDRLLTKARARPWSIVRPTSPQCWVTAVVYSKFQNKNSCNYTWMLPRS